jgi:hypothetical protein
MVSKFRGRNEGRVSDARSAQEGLEEAAEEENMKWETKVTVRPAVGRHMEDDRKTRTPEGLALLSLMALADAFGQDADVMLEGCAEAAKRVRMRVMEATKGESS